VLQERFAYQHGHLRVVRGPAGIPAAASAYLADAVGEVRPVHARFAELEGRAQGVADSGAHDGAAGAACGGRMVLVRHPVRLCGGQASWHEQEVRSRPAKDSAGHQSMESPAANRS
jgi:hypothetical protein